MPIDLPKLDDLDYDDLVEQAVAQIPALYPPWTNHNASDPGITLLELFAWLTDMVLYRTDRIPPDNVRVYLKLLTGQDCSAIPDAELDAAVRRAVLEIRAPHRAITPADYEHLTKLVWPATPAARALHEPILRVECLGQRNCDPHGSTGPTSVADGWVSLLVVPAKGDPHGRDTPPWLRPSTELVNALQAFFRDRVLVTTRLWIGGPGYVNVSFAATLYLEDDADPEAVRAAARAAIEAYYHPVTGGPDGTGWPFGKSVYASEVHVLLGEVEGVSFVGPASSSVPPGAHPAGGGVALWTTALPRRMRDGGAVVGIRLDPHELVHVHEVDLTLMILEGDAWQATQRS